MKKIIYFIMALVVSSCYCDALQNNDYISGREAFYKKEYQMALKYYDNTIAKDETFVDAYCGRGEVEIELKKYNKAIEDYTKAIELDENKIEAYIGRAAAYGLKSKPELKLAKEDLDKALDIDSNNIEAYVSRAVVNFGLKDKDSAYKDINHVLKLEPNNAQAHMIKSMIQFSDFKFADAINSFNKYSELNKEKEEVKVPVIPKFEQGY